MLSWHMPSDIPSQMPLLSISSQLAGSVYSV